MYRVFVDFLPVILLVIGAFGSALGWLFNTVVNMQKEMAAKFTAIEKDIDAAHIMIRGMKCDKQ